MLYKKKPTFDQLKCWTIVCFIMTKETKNNTKKKPLCNCNLFFSFILAIYWLLDRSACVCEWNDDVMWFGINRGLDVSRAYNPDAISPDQMMTGPNPNQPGAAIRMTSATPTMQQRIKALGVATPIALSSPVRRYVLTSTSISKVWQMADIFGSSDPSSGFSKMSITIFRFPNFTSVVRGSFFFVVVEIIQLSFLDQLDPLPIHLNS